MEEVYKNIFMFQVPLPNSALKSINIYVIKSGDKALILDTGYNTEESKIEMVKNLELLNVKIRNSTLILTHLHADHTGLASFFYQQGANLYASKVDGHLMNGMAEGSYWDRLGSFIKLYGVEEEIELKDNPGYNFRLSYPVEFNELKVGEFISWGDYDLEVIDLIGHTPGHIGLYERNHKFLFGADTVLEPITPNITYWGGEWQDILGTYIATLNKVKDMDLEYVFSTHRKLVKDPKKRIDEIIKHHHLRLEEITNAMDFNRNDYTIRDISKNISWKIRANSWDDFPKPQKWFATGETMSHMDYLLNRGYVSVKNVDGTLRFKKEKDYKALEITAL